MDPEIGFWIHWTVGAHFSSGVSGFRRGWERRESATASNRLSSAQWFFELLNPLTGVRRKWKCAAIRVVACRSLTTNCWVHDPHVKMVNGKTRYRRSLKYCLRHAFATVGTGAGNLSIKTILSSCDNCGDKKPIKLWGLVEDFLD